MTDNNKVGAGKRGFFCGPTRHLFSSFGFSLTACVRMMHTSATLLLLLICAGPIGGAEAAPVLKPKPSSYAQPEVTGAVLVKLREVNVGRTGDRVSMNTRLVREYRRIGQALSDALRHKGLFSGNEDFFLKNSLGQGVVGRAGAMDPEKATDPENDRYLRLVPPKDRSLNALLEELHKDANVEYAEPEYLRRIVRTPNDPLLSKQYSHSVTSVAQAWDKTTGADVTIAIVDTGVALNHPDLVGALVSSGHDFANNDEDATDDNGHGTFCAGLAAARGDNALGVTGVAFEAKILPVKVLSTSGSGTDSDVAAGIRFAADQGAKVISLSLGGPGFSQTLQDSVRYAVSRGAVVVAAAGNQGTDLKHYPAAYEEVVAVAATDSEDRRAHYSNFGDWVDIAAPGDQVISTSSDGEFAQGSGTSFAAPYVAGALALLRSTNPGWTYEQVRDQLARAGDDLTTADDFIETSLGAGRINVAKLVGAAPPTSVRVLSLDFKEITASKDGLVRPGDQFSAVMRVNNLGGDVADVTLQASSSSARISIVDGESHYGSLLSGMSSGNEGDPVSFSIAADAPSGEEAGIVQLKLLVEGRIVWERGFPIAVNLPEPAGFPLKVGGSFPSSITVEDIIGDSGKEVLFGNQNQQLFLYTATGESVTGWPRTLTGTHFFHNLYDGIAVGDITGDERKEIIVAPSSQFINIPHPVFALSGNGETLAGWPKLLSAPVPHSRFPGTLVDFGSGATTLVDLSGDGKLDVLFAEGLQVAEEGVPSKMYGYKGDGSPLQGFPFSFEDHYEASSALIVTDVDGNLSPEIATLTNGNHVALFRANGNSLFSAEAGSLNEFATRFSGLSSADIFGTGRRRVSVVSGTGLNVFGPTGRQDRGFPSIEGLPADTEDGLRTWIIDAAGASPIWGDFDGDTFFEGIYAARGTVEGRVRLLLNAVDPYGDVRPGFPYIFGKFPGDVVTGQTLAVDLNGDGKLEFIVLYTHGVEVVGHDAKRIPRWSFQFPRGCTAEAPFTPTVDDINRDGVYEVLYSCKVGSTFALHATTLVESKVSGVPYWPMYQRDAARSGFVPGKGSIPPTPTPRPTATSTITPTTTPTATPTESPIQPPPPTSGDGAVDPNSEIEAPISGAQATPTATIKIRARWNRGVQVRRGTSTKFHFALVATEEPSESPTVEVQLRIGKKVVVKPLSLKRVTKLKGKKKNEVAFSGSVAIDTRKQKLNRVSILASPQFDVRPLVIFRGR